MFNSLRTRLLIWQVLLLTAVVVSFGSVVFYQWRQILFSELDAELLSSATVLEGTLRGAYTRGLPEGNRPLFPPPPDHRPPQRGSQNDFDRPGPPPGQGRPMAPGGNETESRDGRIIMAGEIAPEIFDLPHSLNVNTDQSRSTYFVIYDVHDQIVARSAEREYRIPGRQFDQPMFSIVGSQRELVLKGPGETRILVGRDMRGLSRKSQGFLMRLFSMGLGILAVACVAGYWVTGRAIAPIRQVNETVQTISGANLQGRIDVSEMDAEFLCLSMLLNQMLDRLESTIEQQQRFIADASHELRTPIAVIGMHSELALSRERTPEEYQKTFQICLRASNRMKSLTEDLLTLARADAGQINNAMENVDLNKIANESIQFLQPLADQHHVSLDHEGEANVIVRGDERLLRQLVDNLVTNAIVHNQPKGLATISIHTNGNRAILKVRDNGPGIPEDKLPNLFDRFFRVNESRSRENGGSGLGLSICKSIAQIHGGELTATSTPATGTIFEVSLPSHQQANSAIRSPENSG